MPTPATARVLLMLYAKPRRERWVDLRWAVGHLHLSHDHAHKLLHAMHRNGWLVRRDELDSEGYRKYRLSPQGRDMAIELKRAELAALDTHASPCA